MTEPQQTGARAMRPEDVPAELVEAAADTIHAHYAAHPEDESEENAIRVVLAAVLPLYERQVRERIAQDLADADDPHATWKAAINIARGDDA